MGQKRCYGCMKIVETTGACPNCGFRGEPNAAHQLPMGVILKGRYLIGRVLGQGGFGITYMGWDGEEKSAVAIKEFFPTGQVHRPSSAGMSVKSYGTDGTSSFENNKKRFAKEANSLMEMRGLAEIVQVKDFFHENNTAYIVMEYVEGITLKDYLKQSRTRPLPETILSLLKPLMEALSKVHGLNMIHRDISPDNIMLTRAGGIKLIDFGTVRYMDASDLSRSTESILKPGFAPMEQYQTHGKIGPWTDVYALCATIYYCMTGRLLQDAPSRMVDNAPVDLKRILPNVDGRVAQALEVGLANRHTDRLQSVDELYRLLYRVDIPGTKSKEAKKETFPPKQPKRQDPVHTPEKKPVRDVESNPKQPSSQTVPPKVSPSPTKSNSKKTPASAKSPTQPKIRKKGNRGAWVAGAVALAIFVIVMMPSETGRVTSKPFSTTQPGSTGYIQQGWVSEGDSTYYYEDGEPVTGWFTVDEHTYYADINGCVAFNRNVLIGEDLYYFDGEGAISGICYNRLPSRLAEKLFYFESSHGDIRDVTYRELEMPVENCTGFDFHLNVTQVESGNSDGEWVVCLRINGQWERIQKMDVTSQYGVAHLEFEQPMSFDGFTAYRNTYGYFRGSCEYEIENIMIQFK